MEIVINDNGISVAVDNVLYDAQGNPVSVSNHRSAVGIGDFAQDPANPTDAELAAMRTAVRALAERVLGADLAEGVAAQATLLSAYEHVKQSRQDLRAQVETLSSRVAQLEEVVDASNSVQTDQSVADSRG